MILHDHGCISTKKPIKLLEKRKKKKEEANMKLKALQKSLKWVPSLGYWKKLITLHKMHHFKLSR